MLDIQTLSVTIAAVSVVAGIVYYSFQIRNQTKARQSDLVIRLYTGFSTKEFQEADLKVLNTEFKDYNDFVKKYGAFTSGKPIHKAILMVSSFFELIGVLLYRKLIDAGMVENLFSVRIRWEKLKPIAEELRKHYSEPRLYEWFEYLYNEMKKRESMN